MMLILLVLFFLVDEFFTFEKEYVYDDETVYWSNLGKGMQTYGGTTEYQHSSYFYNFYWGDIEPTRGDIQYDLIDNILDIAKEKGELLGFRISSFDDDNDPIPDWLKTEIGVDNGIMDTKGNWIPNQNNPTFLSEVERLMKAIGLRYNGNKWIEYLDIGTIGYWGEWHLTYLSTSEEKEEYMPNEANEKKIVDIYYSAFPDTPLVALCGPENVLVYASSKGSGFRCDCFGDVSDGWNHMRDMYPDRILSYGDRWKTAPVMWETCWTVQEWVDEDFNLTQIFELGLDWHTSALGNKNEAIPAEADAQFNNFVMNMGYRFFIPKIEVGMKKYSNYPELKKIIFKSEWKNFGVAPTYLDLDLMLRGEYKDNSTKESFSSYNMRTILPYSYDSDETYETYDEFELVDSNAQFERLDICLFYQVESARRLEIKIALKDEIIDENGCYNICDNVDDCNEVLVVSDEIFDEDISTPAFFTFFTFFVIFLIF